MQEPEMKVAKVWVMELTNKGRFYRIYLKPHKCYNTVETAWLTPKEANWKGVRVGCRVRYEEIDGRINILGVDRKKSKKNSANG